MAAVKTDSTVPKKKNFFYTELRQKQSCLAGSAQTLPNANATPPIGKIHLFSNIAINDEQ